LAKFDGGLLSSDGGVLVLREVEQHLGVADRLAACLVDRRAPELIAHTLADIIRFRLLVIGAAYEDGNDAGALRSDPLFKMALDLAPSAVDHIPPGKPAGRARLLRIGRAIVDLYCGSYRQVPKRIVPDIDDTIDAVQGGQQLRLFNAYYDEYGLTATGVS
jgi:Transposase DDE domain group 1